MVGLLALGALACSSPEVGPPPPLRAFGAASLTEVLPALARAWRQDGPPAVDFTFDATSRLAKAVENGQGADLFFSADQAWVDHLVAVGRLDPATRRDLASNDLVLVVPVGAPAPDSMSALLARDGRLALAGPNVPAGRYADAALAALGLAEALEPRVVRGDSVRTALTWVARGEAAAGLVYATDARVEPRVQVAFTLPAGLYPPVTYPAAVVVGSERADEATDFLRFCGSPAGRAVWAEAGFRPAGSP